MSPLSVRPTPTNMPSCAGVCRWSHIILPSKISQGPYRFCIHRPARMHACIHLQRADFECHGTMDSGRISAVVCCAIKWLDGLDPAASFLAHACTARPHHCLQVPSSDLEPPGCRSVPALSQPFWLDVWQALVCGNSLSLGTHTTSHPFSPSSCGQGEPDAWSFACERSLGFSACSYSCEDRSANT